MELLAFFLISIFRLSCVRSVDSNCYDDATKGCYKPASHDIELPNCNALYGAYLLRNNFELELETYAKLHLGISYEYLLTSAYFNNYRTQRPGFSKLFRQLSDRAWDKSIEIIQHITKRGGMIDLSQQDRRPEVSKNSTFVAELPEVVALGKALDTQKEIAERAFEIHEKALRMDQKLHDTEIAQYIEKEFTEYQSKAIRDLTGHVTDLKMFASVVDDNDDVTMNTCRRCCKILERRSFICTLCTIRVHYEIVIPTSGAIAYRFNQLTTDK